MNAQRFFFVAALLLLSNPQFSTVFAQGSLTPPGATMKSLDQVEPRTAITNLPFTITKAAATI
jgi:hypothetical protein